MKQKIYNLIDEKNQKGLAANRWINLGIITLIMASVVEAILESFPGIRTAFSAEISWFEIVVVTVFTTEYILRLWTADLKYQDTSPVKARIKFVTSFSGIIDLLAIIPFYLPKLIAMDLRYIRIFRVTRLLRILKYKRYMSALTGLRQAFISKGPQLFVTIAVCIILIMFSSALMFNLQRYAQPEAFSSIPETFYWSISTLTTVGYGDVVPITTGGKILAGFISFIGVAFIALPAGIMSSALMSHIAKDGESAARYCAHCEQPMIMESNH